MPETKRFYYFTTAKYALKAVKDHQLKATELNKANDPYEMLPFQLKSAHDDKIAQLVRDDFATFMKMICFSTTFNNPALWGLYSDKCKGVCLGFDIDVYGTDEEMDPVLNIRKVNYKTTRPEMEDFGFESSSGMPVNTTGETYKIFYVKSHHWEHEQEWRLMGFVNSLKLDVTSGLYFFPFSDRLKLRDILIGFRCEEQDIESRFDRLIADDRYPHPKPRIVPTRPSRSAFEIEKAT